MAKVPHGVETLPKISITWVGCTNVTDDRQATDGRPMTYSECAKKFETRKTTVCSFFSILYKQHSPVLAVLPRTLAFTLGVTGFVLCILSQQTGHVSQLIAIILTQPRWSKRYDHLDIVEFICCSIYRLTEHAHICGFLGYSDVLTLKSRHYVLCSCIIVMDIYWVLIL